MNIRDGCIRAFHLSGLAVLVATTTIACSVDSEIDNTPTDTGFRVGIQALGHELTEQFQFDVRTCDDTPVTSGTAGLSPLKLPGGLSTFQDAPYDADSAHSFADRYFLLDAGCYLVDATPLDGDGTPVEECSAVLDKQVVVSDGDTTEILLISQCEGAERGGLDVIGSLNHPPEIDNLTYTPSKFVACPQTVEICVDASDPDSDPMRVDWSVLSGPVPETPVAISESTSANGSLRECIAFEPGVGEWTIEVTVFDQIAHLGEHIDFEAYYQMQGISELSRDDLRFPLYGGGSCRAVDAGFPDVSEPDANLPDPDAGIEPDADSPLAGCTRTRGYWSTHDEYQTGGLYDDWPSPHDEMDLLCGSTWMSVVGLDGTGNVWNRLAPQWIAATLNLAAGADAPQSVLDAQAQAGQMLTDECGGIPTAEAQDAEDLKDLLDDFNNGVIGPGTCE